MHGFSPYHLLILFLVAVALVAAKTYFGGPLA
jgi:hypothetical protein